MPLMQHGAQIASPTSRDAAPARALHQTRLLGFASGGAYFWRF